MTNDRQTFIQPFGPIGQWFRKHTLNGAMTRHKEKENQFVFEFSKRGCGRKQLLCSSQITRAKDSWEHWPHPHYQKKQIFDIFFYRASAKRSRNHCLHQQNLILRMPFLIMKWTYATPFQSQLSHNGVPINVISRLLLCASKNYTHLKMPHMLWKCVKKKNRRVLVLVGVMFGVKKWHLYMFSTKSCLKKITMNLQNLTFMFNFYFWGTNVHSWGTNVDFWE